ncbi:srd1p [Saccharomyces arboricola H-6]|uniref:Srd1p n=1 Tax=Saccharomyces arboricola (strain H-6 / AS 2.3317 / CBS 10644) TaxID=1160507 RepID=J8PQV1_SACAR|nr:srd1p [Saccharomyces arboricola H-6]
MHCNDYDISGSSFLTRVVKKTDAKKNLLQNREIGGWKPNNKVRAYDERGKVYVSCSFIEVSLSQVEIIDVQKKFENAERLRDITRNILKNKTDSSQGMIPSKIGATSTCGFQKSTLSAGITDSRNTRCHGQGTNKSTSFTKRDSKKTVGRPKREKRQTILPTGEIKECAKCKDTWTIQWRSGPAHSRELCSPCGLAYGKRLKKEEDEKKRQELNKKRMQNDP